MSNSNLTGSSESDRNRYLVITVNKQFFGIPLLKVKEVIGYSVPTPIPNAPNYMKGVINLRGNVLTILDLSIKLKVNSTHKDAEKAIILLDTGSVNLAIIVDTVDKVIEIKATDVSPSLEITRNLDMVLIKGVAKYEKDLILILDTDNLISVDDQNNIKKVA